MLSYISLPPCPLTFVCFLQGFFDGVTGIVRKPVEGAKQQGVEGFFKGLYDVKFHLLIYS